MEKIETNNESQESNLLDEELSERIRLITTNILLKFFAGKEFNSDRRSQEILFWRPSDRRKYYNLCLCLHRQIAKNHGFVCPGKFADDSSKRKICGAKPTSIFTICQFLFFLKTLGPLISLHLI